MTMNKLQGMIRRKLVEAKKNPLISSYYAQKKARNKPDSIGDVGE